MVGKLCENGDVEEANARLTALLEKGFLADEITHTHLIDGYGKKEDAAASMEEAEKPRHKKETVLNGVNEFLWGMLSTKSFGVVSVELVPPMHRRFSPDKEPLSVWEAGRSREIFGYYERSFTSSK
ncbi:hypothetical protein FEM48_Zijuj04G0170700 [Ziziphus jujuba var. spinosa]|uniref:Uncharacterized protein n=1 Tax=Ziziphus jujuba var. spinosa TaxID=714518 RepID=A0A978VL36_ZIZJJ|nr:hypothetical protein FEM48_Zijuj04G0170700 [Ziziphus jujuba var. spinosa]